MKDIARGLLRGLLIGAAVIALVKLLNWLIPYDDSDSPPRRSGMVIYKDHLTGCEYLGKFFGGVTPRLDTNGRQVCRKS